MDVKSGPAKFDKAEMAGVEVRGAAVVRFKIAVHEKTWVKWRGRRAIPGWRARRSRHFVQFRCREPQYIPLMTKEVVSKIALILYMMSKQEQPDE